MNEEHGWLITEIDGKYYHGSKDFTQAISEIIKEKKQELEKRFDEWETNRGAYVFPSQEYRDELRKILFGEAEENKT